MVWYLMPSCPISGLLCSTFQVGDSAMSGGYSWIDWVILYEKRLLFTKIYIRDSSYGSTYKFQNWQSFPASIPDPDALPPGQTLEMAGRLG